jgi:hypothetical protein
MNKNIITADNCKVRITENYSVELPAELKNIADEIKNAVSFLKNVEDWDTDEEGELYTFSKLQKAANFLVDYALWVLGEHDLVIATPNIYPGPDGSVDILWKNEEFKLLINVQPHPNVFATFFGKVNDGEEFIEGKFKTGNINQNVFLVLLKQYNEYV